MDRKALVPTAIAGLSVFMAIESSRLLTGSAHAEPRPVALAGTASATVAEADALRVIPFQAYLTDSEGRPLTGAHTLTFRLFDVPTDGQPLFAWSEAHSNVAISNGLASVHVGSVTPFPVALSFGGLRYLEVRVDNDLPLAPRYRIIPSIFAADADRAEHAQLAAHSYGLVGQNDPTPMVVVGLGGQVGIGTTNPQGSLHITGTNGASTATVIETTGVEPATGATLAFRRNGADKKTIGLDGINDLGFYQGSGSNAEATDRMFLKMFTSTGHTMVGGSLGIRTTDPRSTLDVNGSFAAKTTVVHESKALDINEHVIFVDAVASVTLTLPTAAGIAGRVYIIKNIGTGKVVISPVTSQTIDGIASYTLASKLEGIHIVSDGNGWQSLAGGTYPRAILTQGAAQTVSPGQTFRFPGAPLEDTHLAWNGTTSTFTAPVSGLYLVNMMLHYGGGTNTQDGVCPRAQVNGVTYRHRSFQTSIANQHVQGSDVFHLRSGDQLRFLNECSGTIVTISDSLGQWVWMTIERIR